MIRLAFTFPHRGQTRGRGSKEDSMARTGTPYAEAQIIGVSREAAAGANIEVCYESYSL